ncbi:hypothetical protein BX600DRAFT_506298 [Xylariales sp. PMI_506]|nr:hypothetical protein BX600DRAFT_506298 [Xylariales sp. PMI_506]
MKNVLLALSLLASAAVGAVAQELKIDVTYPVECERKTEKGDTIEAHYLGTLLDGGKKFDSSYDRGKPFTFKLGVGQVIKGTLTVPPELGYGQRNMGAIPPGSTLVFEVEIVGIKGVPKPETIIPKVVESSASSAASDAATGVAEKVASKVSEAAEVVKTIVADSDDGQEHNEL